MNFINEIGLSRQAGRLRIVALTDSGLVDFSAVDPDPESIPGKRHNLTIVDLDSHNGAIVVGEVLHGARRALRPGDESLNGHSMFELAPA